MVEEIEGVVNDVPAPNEAPPVEAAYQLSVPLEAVAPRLKAPLPQRLAGVVPLTDGMLLTLAKTDVRAAEVQPVLLASAK